MSKTMLSYVLNRHHLVHHENFGRKLLFIYKAFSLILFKGHCHYIVTNMKLIRIDSFPFPAFDIATSKSIISKIYFIMILNLR